jgi:hypothetical protein
MHVFDFHRVIRLHPMHDGGQSLNKLRAVENNNFPVHGDRYQIPLSLKRLDRCTLFACFISISRDLSCANNSGNLTGGPSEPHHDHTVRASSSLFLALLSSTPPTLQFHLARAHEDGLPHNPSPRWVSDLSIESHGARTKSATASFLMIPTSSYRGIEANRRSQLNILC